AVGAWVPRLPGAAGAGPPARGGGRAARAQPAGDDARVGHTDRRSNDGPLDAELHPRGHARSAEAHGSSEDRPEAATLMAPEFSDLADSFAAVCRTTRR